MKRRWFAVVGATILVLDAYVVVEVGPVSGGPLPPVLIAVAALLFLVGGFDPVPNTLPWFRFVGLGLVVFGAIFLVVWTGPALQATPSTNSLVLALAGTFNALVLGLVGLDVLNGGRYFDLSVYEPGPILDGSEDGE